MTASLPSAPAALHALSGTVVTLTLYILYSLSVLAVSLFLWFLYSKLGQKMLAEAAREEIARNKPGSP